MPIDPATIAAIGGTLASAGGTIAGALGASRDVGTASIRRRNPDPINDPLLSGLSAEALLGLGSTAGLSAFMDQASPTSQFIDSIMRTDQLTDKQKRRAVNGIRWYQERGLDPFDATLLTQIGPDGKPLVPGNIRKIRGEILRASQTVGFGSFGDFRGLQRAQQEFEQQAQAFQARVAPIANTIRDNRLAGIANLADIAGNAGLRTDQLAALYEPQIAREFQDQRNQILQSANAGRFNPGAALGRLGETQALSQRSSAIERALQILGGQATITQQALAPAQTLAAQTSAQRQGATLNLANIGAAQQQAQQQIAQNRAGALGTGIASAGSQIGNLGLLVSILGNNSGGPAGRSTEDIMAGLRNEVANRNLGGSA